MSQMGRMLDLNDCFVVYFRHSMQRNRLNPVPSFIISAAPLKIRTDNFQLPNLSDLRLDWDQRTLRNASYTVS